MIFILIGLAAVIGFFVASAILWGLSKLFKISNATYKKSMLVYSLTALSSAVITGIFTLVDLGVFSQVLAVIITFFVFNYLFKKYYQTSWKKALGVYITNIIREADFLVALPR